MKTILRSKSKFRASIKPRPNLFITKVEDYSNERLESSINHCYHSDRFWLEYIDIYRDLFTDMPTAELKAKTHAVATTCLTIRYKHGVSFHRIYYALVKQVQTSKIVLSKEILNIESKWLFVDSLHDI